MTQEQLKKAIELNNKLNLLYRLQKEIEGTISHRLSYIEKCDRELGYSGPDWKPCNIRTFEVIGHILDKHDVQIRKEIEEEINKVMKEIEEL